MMRRWLLIASVAAAYDPSQATSQTASRVPPVEEVNRALAAAKAALASAASEKAEAQKQMAAAQTEKQATEAKLKAEEQKISAEKTSLRWKRQQLQKWSDKLNNAQKDKQDAVWAQADAQSKLMKDKREREMDESVLKNAVADNDAAAKMALGAKKQLDKAHAQVAEMQEEVKQYKAKAHEAAAAEKVAQDAKAHADALSRQRSAELAVLQEAQKARAKDKAKLDMELKTVENARQAVTAALAEAKNATKVAAQEVTGAAQKKKQADVEMQRAQKLMQVAKQMHDVAERAMVAARVLQNSGTASTSQGQAQAQPMPTAKEVSPDPFPSPAHDGESEKAMEAAVAAASKADARLQTAQQELMKAQEQKAHEEEWLSQKKQELTRTSSSLEHSRAEIRRDEAELTSVYSEVRILQLVLFLALASAGGVAYYFHQKQALPEPKPFVVTEEKAVGKSAQSPISQSPLHLPVMDASLKPEEDFQEVQKEAKSDTPHFTPRSSPQTTPRLPPPPFGLGGAVNIPSLALPSQTGPKRYYMSPRCVKESPQMSRQTSPSVEGKSPDVASSTKQELPDLPKVPALPGSGKEPLKQPLLKDA